VSNLSSESSSIYINIYIYIHILLTALMSPKILFVFTSANKSLTGANTGWYLPEAAHPYYILAPHVEIDFAAPAGPNPPVDEYSVQMFTDEESVKFLKDPVVKHKLENALVLKTVSASDYDGIFYIGGHGPVIDLAIDKDNIKLANAFYRSNKLVSAVCHGPGALVGVTDAEGKSIFAGKEATSFTNFEEEQVDKVKDIPFLVETRIIELGGKFVSADAAWGVKVVESGNLITGQNPASAGPIGHAILKKLTA